MEILTNLLGFLIGAAASFCVWLYLYRFIVPRIEFSNKISKIVRRGEAIYRVKFNNLSKRNVIDISITANLNILGLFDEQPNNWKHVYVKLNLDYLPVLKNPKSGGLLANLYINHTEEFARYPFPKDINKKYNDKSLLLEDIFDIGKNVELSFIIMGYDQFSGARKIFESKKYTKEDIISKVFEHGSLSIKFD